MKLLSGLMTFMLLASAGQAWSASDVMSAHVAQIRQVKNHFNNLGEWKGTTPEHEVRWLGATTLQGNDYRVTTLAIDADQKSCARLCLDDLYCAAFTFVPVSSSNPAPQCSLKYEGFKVQAQAGSISGLVRSPG